MFSVATLTLLSCTFVTLVGFVVYFFFWRWRYRREYLAPARPSRPSSESHGLRAKVRRPRYVVTRFSTLTPLRRTAGPEDPGLIRPRLGSAEEQVVELHAQVHRREGPLPAHAHALLALAPGPALPDASRGALAAPERARPAEGRAFPRWPHVAYPGRAFSLCEGQLPLAA